MPSEVEVFELTHNEVGKEENVLDAEEFRVIGVFSSRAVAEAAIATLNGKQGFRCWPDGFRIYADFLDYIRYPGGGAGRSIHRHPDLPQGFDRPSGSPQTVWEVTFLRLRQGEAFDAYHDDLWPFSIGIFSSHELAEAAIDFVKDNEDFRDWPDGFRITERVIDQPAYPNGY